MSEKLNFGDIPDNSGEFSALPEDRYTVECVEAKLAKSKAGNKKITAQFKVVDGEYKNRRLWNDFSLVPNALFNLKKYFDAAGLPTDEEMDFDDVPAVMTGSTSSVYVTQEEYNGKPQNRLGEWAAVSAAGGDSLFN